MARVEDPYESDTSISYESLGYPSDPSGLFKRSFDHAARAYKADHTLFSVNGTTGSNFMVLKALSKQVPNLRVLAGRNVHRSVVTASEDYGINLFFLAPHIDRQLQLFLPNTEQEIMDGIARTKPHVLLMTNPTYEGLTVDLRGILASIRRQFADLIVFVDEAWGAHLQFSKKLPVSAMVAGADICVQSTHKQGGSLQQTGMIHWKNGRINFDLLMDAYRTLGTSSPSYFLMASLDAAREAMQRHGRQRIDHILDVAGSLAMEIGAIDGFRVLTTEQLREASPSVHQRDETKVIVDVGATGLSGYQIASVLERRFEIVVEAYNVRTVLLLVPFRAELDDVRVTSTAVKEIARGAPGCRHG